MSMDQEWLIDNDTIEDVFNVSLCFAQNVLI